MTFNKFITVAKQTHLNATIAIFNKNEFSRSYNLLSEAIKLYKDKLYNAQIDNICINGDCLQITVDIET